MTCTLWFTYGMMTDQPPLIRVNSIGIVLEIAYSAYFLFSEYYLLRITPYCCKRSNQNKKYRSTSTASSSTCHVFHALALVFLRASD